MPLEPLGEPATLISDVHGNLEALRAVLAEADVRAPGGALFCAGDLLLGGPAPLDTWRLLRERGARAVRGLSDVALCDVDPVSLRPTNEEEAQKAADFARTRAAVGDLVVQELRQLPLQLRVPLVDGRELLLVHGCPSDTGREMTHDLSDAELFALIADDPADIVACGASHVPFQRALDGVHVVNLGSVGAAPEGRVAHYTIVRPRMSGAEIEQCYVEY